MSEGTKAALRWWAIRLALIPVIFFVVATVLHFLLYGPFVGSLCDIVFGPGCGDVLDEQVVEELGFNDNWGERYWDWISNAVRGDCGQSWVTEEPVELLDREKLEFTLAFVLVGLGSALGTAFALRAVRRWTTVWQLVASALAALPFFALATMTIILPSYYLNYAFPVGSVRLWDDPWDTPTSSCAFGALRRSDRRRYCLVRHGDASRGQFPYVARGCDCISARTSACAERRHCC